jgi:hypothetical protein
MPFLDISANGSLADEAALLTAAAAVIGAATGTIVALVRREVRANHSTLAEVASTLNGVDEECPEGDTPTLGQRVVRIEKQVDSIQSTLLDLSTTMTEHIHWEQKKADRIDSRLIKVEDTLEELERRIVSEPDAPSPTKRQTPKKRTS